MNTRAGTQTVHPSPHLS